MDFIKFQKINNHSSKNILSKSEKVLESNSNIRDFVENLAKENFDIDSGKKDQININISSNQKPCTNKLVDNFFTKASNNPTNNNNNSSINELDEIIKNRNRKTSIRDKIKYFESQYEEMERLKHNSSLIGIAKKYGYDETKDSNSIKNILNKDVSFLGEVQALFDEYESKLNTANLKISEIMKENNNLKGKIKTLEESSKKECETLKKSLVEALEKYKLIEKKTDVESCRNSLHSNLLSLSMTKFETSPKHIPEDIDIGENVDNKILKYEEKIEKLVLENEKLIDEMSIIEEMKQKINLLENENKYINEKNQVFKQYEEKYKFLLLENENLSNENSKLIKIIEIEDIKVYSMEEQLSNLKNKIKTDGEIKITEIFEQHEERVRSLESENLEFKEKILIKEDIINDLSIKYSEYDKHLTQICEGLYEKNDPLQFLNTKPKFTDEFVVDLIVSNILNSYYLENSIDLDKINRKIVGNYNLFLNTIFLNNEENNCSSLIHEYFEDVFFRIYNFYLKKMFKNKDINTNSDFWEISGHQINDNEVNMIAYDILNSNNLSLISKFLNLNNISSIEKIKNKFYENYKHYFKDENIFDEIINKESEIDKKINSHLLKNKQNSTSLIRDLIQICKNNLFSGKIVEKDYQIYNFKKFYIEYLNLEKLNFESSFNFINYLDSQDTVDHLTNSIKYKQHPMNSLVVTTNVNGKINFPLGKLVQCLLMYSSELNYLSMTEACFNKIQFQYIIKLVKFSSLEVLDLSNNKLGDASILLLSDSLKQNNSLKILYLTNNLITSLGGSYLSELFTSNKSIEKVNLGGNKISDSGLHCMINSISINQNIKHLDISDNKLSHNDLIYICNHLISKNQTIEIINLSNNRFDPESVNVFGLCLKNNNSLKILYMNSVYLNEDSSPYLFQHLGGTKITELNLDNNYLGEIGGILFANVLKNNLNLKIVSMKKCELNSMSLHCISKALEINKTLRLLNLEENAFDDLSLTNLNRIIEIRPIKISFTSPNLINKSYDIIRKNSTFLIN